MKLKRDTEGYIYRYEMHCHNSWCSACGHSTPQEMAEAYYNAGYAGMVITDHFLWGNTAVDRSLPWEEKMRCYYAAYEAARKWAEGKDFHVLFGIEHAYGSGKEVLTYGIDLDFLLGHPEIHTWSLDDYCDAVRAAGGFVSMAHPYRHAGYIDPNVGPRPECLDGAEVFNFYNTDEENQAAEELAETYGLLPTSGGDEHVKNGASIGQSGIALKQPVDTGAELVKALRSGDYRLIIKGQLV